MIQATSPDVVARLEGRDGTSAAVLLRLLLEEGRYGVVQAMTRRFPLDAPFVDPFSDHRLEEAVSGYPALTRTLVRLFTLGAVVARPELAHTLGEESVGPLERAGILEAADGGLRARWLVATYLNRHFLASAPFWMRPYRREEGIVYVGPESYWFARLAANCGPFEAALDLGTGTGFLASIVDARRVTAVEVDPVAAAVARFNLRLNGLEDRIELLHGDLYQPLGGRRFDLIVSNPPFIPSRSPAEMPLCGAGGGDGETVLRRLLLELDSHLQPAGQALVYGESFGDADEPFVAGWLRETGPDRLAFSLSVRSSQSLEAAGLRLTSLWQEVGCPEAAAWDAWNRLVTESGATYHHSYVLWASRGIGRVSVHHPFRV